MKLLAGVPKPSSALNCVVGEEISAAVFTIYSLVSQSVNDDWEVAKFRPEYFENSTPGQDFSVCYKWYTGDGDPSYRKLHVRIDLILPNLDLDSLKKLYWDVCVEESFYRYVFGAEFETKIVPVDTFQTNSSTCT